MIWWRKINTTEGDDLVQCHPRSHRLQRGVQMNLTKQDLFMSRATPPVALSFREFLVKILKPEKDRVLELVKNVSCNPNTAGLYFLESRVSSSKLAWKPRTFHWIMECSIASVRRDDWRVHLIIGQGRKLVRKNQTCSAFFSLSEATGLGGTWGLLEGLKCLGCENPLTSTRTPLPSP